MQTATLVDDERRIREQWDRLLARGCDPELLVTAVTLWRETYGWRPTDGEGASFTHLAMSHQCHFQTSGFSWPSHRSRLIETTQPPSARVSVGDRQRGLATWS